MSGDSCIASFNSHNDRYGLENFYCRHLTCNYLREHWIDWIDCLDVEHSNFVLYLDLEGCISGIKEENKKNMDVGLFDFESIITVFVLRHSSATFPARFVD